MKTSALKIIVTTLFITQISAHEDVAIKPIQANEETQTKIDFLNLNQGKIRNILTDIPEKLEPNTKFDLKTILMSGWSGNGGDTENIRDNIWYLGEKEVQYCIKVDEESVLSKEQASSLVQSSFAKWKSFFKKYKIDERKIGNRLFTLSDNTVKKMSLNFNEVSCDELKESENGEELIFLFGKSNALVEVYKDLNTENAYGLALRKGYNHDTYRNAGLVWITNQLKDIKKIEHLVLHEIGHVFGMKHDSVYVMDKEIVRHVSQRRINTELLGEIEAPYWKFMLQQGQSINLTTTPITARNTTCAADERRNDKLPESILKKLRAKSHECHKVLINIDKENGPKNFDISLKLIGKKKTIELTGNFQASQTTTNDSLFPGVYTKYNNARPQRGTSDRIKGSSYRRMTLGNRFDFPLRGVFKKFGLTLPARIDYKDGLRLEVLHKNNWWVIK